MSYIPDLTTGRAWQLGYALDLTALATLAASGNGNFTIDGKTWTIANFGAASAMGLVNGSGFQITPDATNTTYNATPTCPLIYVPISTLLTDFKTGKYKLRIFLHVTFSNLSASAEAVHTAIEDLNGGTVDYAKTGGSILSWHDGVNEKLTFRNAGTDEALGNIVPIPDVHAYEWDGSKIIYAHGTYSSGFPDWADLLNFRIGSLGNASPENLLTADDLAFVFAVATNAVSMDVVGKLQHIRIEFMER